MKGLNNPIGIKSSEPSQSPFIMNPYRFVSGGVFTGQTRGVFVGGNVGVPAVNVMNYITIATTGNATDFGDLTVSRMDISGLASDTRGVIGRGWIGTVTNVMDYKESILTIVVTAMLIGYSRIFIKYPQDFKNGNKRKH